MRLRAALRCLTGLLGMSVAASAQTCTGLCLQQVSCPNGGTTSISGTVYTPNGTDPLPNVLVYIPNAPVDVFTSGVSCAVAGQPPSGSPLVGTTTAVDGTFTIDNVPVGTNIPLVIQSGRWRRQLVVPTTAACADTGFSTRMPRNRSEGDIPKIAIATGMADQVECVLRKVGVEDAEFTNPSGHGRINLYTGDDWPGAQIDGGTPKATTLLSTQAAMNAYDVVMLPCEGAQFAKPADQLSNFVSFANAGGRIYSSHYSYVYMDGNPSLPAIADWHLRQRPPADGVATVDISFAEGETLAQWLQLVGATTTEGQMSISTLRHDLDGVVAPTQSWLRLNDLADGNPVMQFVYDAPVGAANQCGRVLFNEYHVENPVSSPRGVTFPQECSAEPMSPQEKLLEYSLFELTNDGGEPTITPTSADFGPEPVGFTTATKSFTWTNHSTFTASAKASATTSDYLVTSSNCSGVAGGGSCTISVAFRPTALGTRAAELTVTSTGPSLTAALTGVGTPDLSISPATTLQFGSRDIGDPVTQTLTVTNANGAAVAFPPPVLTGDYTATSMCGSMVAALSSCTVTVTFTPATTGDRPGTLTLGINPALKLDGNGVDFTTMDSPGSGSVIAGLSVGTNVLTTPIAGFSNLVKMSCTTTAPAATCVLAAGSFTPVAATGVGVEISTVSKYAVIGYGGMGGPGWWWLVGAASGLALWWRRRGVGRLALMAVVLGVGAMSVTGCSGMLPARNASYTPPGTYAVTISATDGFLVHTATYTMTVTAN